MSAGRSRTRRHVAAAIALVAAGCLPFVKRERSGSLLPDEPVAALRDGVTTRREVLDALGPPAAVARAGEVARVALLGVADVGVRSPVGGAPALFGGAAVSTAAFLEPFRDGDRGHPSDLVYYYEAQEIRDSSLSFAILGPYAAVELPVSGRREGRTEQLWILVDGETGIVRAHVQRRSRPLECDGRLERTPATPEAPLARPFQCVGTGPAPSPIEEETR